MATRVTRRTVHVTFKRGDLWLLTTEWFEVADGLHIRLRERPGVRGRPPAFSNAGDFVIERLVSFPLDVATGLVAAWLYDVLKRNRATVTMDRDELPVDDEGKLRSFLRKHILPKSAVRRPSKRRARPEARPVRGQRKKPKR